jgi:hypothetical protein
VQEFSSNVQLQTHSPTNEADQCLNWSTKKELFTLKILCDFYFLDIAEYECNKKIAFHSTFSTKVFKLKVTSVITKHYIIFNDSIN